MVNAKVEMQLEQIVRSMRGELLGILRFLDEQAGVRLDDHYRNIRQLVTNAK